MMNNNLKINQDDKEQKYIDRDDKLLKQEYVNPDKTDEIEREKAEQRQIEEQRRRERFNQNE